MQSECYLAIKYIVKRRGGVLLLLLPLLYSRRCDDDGQLRPALMAKLMTLMIWKEHIWWWLLLRWTRHVQFVRQSSSSSTSYSARTSNCLPTWGPLNSHNSNSTSVFGECFGANLWWQLKVVPLHKKNDEFNEYLGRLCRLERVNLIQTGGV